MLHIGFIQQQMRAIIECKINSEKIPEAMVDTGACKTIGSIELVKRLRLKIDKDVVSMYQTAGGGIIKSVGASFNVPISPSQLTMVRKVEDIILFNECDPPLILGNT